MEKLRKTIAKKFTNSVLILQDIRLIKSKDTSDFHDLGVAFEQFCENMLNHVFHSQVKTWNLFYQ